MAFVFIAPLYCVTAKQRIFRSGMREHIITAGKVTLYDRVGIAETLACSVQNIDRMRKAGLLPEHKIGGLIRFTQDDLDECLRRSVIDKRPQV
jgi:hypothetical protein